MASTAPPMPSFTKSWHSSSYIAINPEKSSLSLHGKCVIITGGGSGIGARTALSFAAAGASHIAILGRRVRNLLETKSGVEARYPKSEVHVLPADVANTTAADAAIAGFAQAVGKVDILINNAGVGVKDPLIQDTSVDGWYSSVDINLKGSFNVARAFLNHMNVDAKIVNVASFISFLNVAPQFSSYAVSKAAAVRLFDYVQLQQPGLSVIHVHPGMVQTAITAPGVVSPDDGECRRLHRTIQQGQTDYVIVSLPADFMVWAVSDEAEFLKGKYVFANWDVDEMKERADQIRDTDLLTMTLQGWPFTNLS